MMKYTPKILLLLLLLLTITISTKIVYAEDGDITLEGIDDGDGSGGTDGPGDGSGGPGGSGGASGRPATYDIGTSRYTCTYTKSIGATTNISYSTINSTSDTDTFKSGTWIGLNFIENKIATWSVSNFKYKKIMKKYTCNYAGTTYEKEWYGCKIGSTCPTGYTAGSVPCRYTTPLGKVKPGVNCYKWKQSGSTTTTSDTTLEYGEEYTCPSKTGYNLTSQTYEEVSEDYAGPIQQCITDAITSAKNAAQGISQSPSGKLKIFEPNNYSLEDKIELSPISGGTTSKDYGQYGSYTTSYLYKPSNICMNMKTAKVTYNQECNAIKGEVNIPDITRNNKNYWHYFIPLNTKTGAPFYVNLNKNSKSMLTPGQCVDAMKKYDNYKNIIQPTDGGMYDGDYNKKETEEYNSKRSKDYQKVKSNGGCYIELGINFDIVQKFYEEKEEKGTTKLDGYKFYYRPIDTTTFSTETFSSDSYWYEWSKNKKSPDISKSFNEVSYTAIPNTGKIRYYNSQYKYTDWTDMDLNGISTFIGRKNVTSEYGITRNGNPSFYKLGCGPANSSWEECKK